MANEVLVGLKIGASVASTLGAAFGSAKSTVTQLGRATEGLTSKQKLIGTRLAESLARGGSGIERMRRQYDSVGRTIDQLKIKQEQLNTSIARGARLKAERADLRGQALETGATAVAVLGPVVKSLRTAIDFQDQLRDISITADFSPAAEAELGQLIRWSAVRTNQTHTDIGAGVGELVAGNLGSLEELKMFTPVMAEVATATRASMEDLAKTTIALSKSMGITGEDYRSVMNMLAAGGKEGQFELQDMAKWLPVLASTYGAMGQKGKNAVAELTASLQIARMGAGSSDEAANNYKNFLSKLNSPDTIKAFEDAGIDLQASMRSGVASGLSPEKSMLNIVTHYLGNKGPEAAEKYKKALEITDDVERENAIQRLDEAYKLGRLFRDQQAMGYLRPALANQGEKAAIEKVALNAADQDVNGRDFAKRMDTAKSSLGAFKIGMTELALSVGDALLPAVNDLLKSVIPVVQRFATWAGENPGLIKGVVTLVAGLFATKLAFIGVAYGANLILSPFVSIYTTVKSLSAKWTLLRAAWQLGKFAPLISGLGKAGRGMLTVARYGGLLLRGTFMAFSAPLMGLARGGLFLGKILGGTLLYGLKLAGQAVLWMGRALLMNPIGLAITGIALSAYLIYKYWAPIKAFVGGLWAEIKAGVNGGLSGILGLIVNFSPLGLFYRAFAGVMSYFGLELPGKFSEFGSMLISGLVNGITGMAGKLKESVLGVGSSIKGWFTDTLGIQSPSRVFMGYGANLSEGAALGITAQSGLVRQAALAMAGQSRVDLAPPNPAAVSMASMMGGGAAGGKMEFHFSPQINVPAGGAVAEQVNQGLQASYSEWMRMMERFMHDKKRRSFGGPNEGSF
ncbi:phage tail tape measure protein [Pseudomonas sp. 18175]|uniref:phage tail tape measure protein n=1 Tax=Pseudomonas sp. 18175 TaxID=3390056 RepID=UPI003D252D92